MYRSTALSNFRKTTALMRERLGFDATVCITTTTATATSLCRIAIEKLSCVSKNRTFYPGKNSNKI